MQSGASLCDWSESDLLCTVSPPPEDPKFTILVALLTVTLSLPIVMIIQYVLETYASHSPASQGFEDDVKVKREEAGKVEEGKVEESETLDALALLLRAGGQSDFGEIIKNGVLKNSTSNAFSPSEVAQYAYAGKLLDTPMMRC